MSIAPSRTSVEQGYTPYSKYRTSGIQWLGRIPHHWEIAPVFSRYHVQLGKMLNREAREGDCRAPYLRNANIQWDHIDLSDLKEMHFSANERRKFALTFGDLLVCEGGEVGRTAIWRGELDECFFQKAIHRVRPIRATEEPRYLFYLLYTATQRGVFEADGNRSTIVHLTAEKLRKRRFPFPGLPEQRAIAAFLDRETERLDTLISKKQRLIELLEEKRTALISRAVTKGLDPDVPMKDSGVEWLGEVPAYWDVAKTKYVARLESGHTPSRSKPEYWEDCTIPWFTLADVWQLRDGTREYVSDTKGKVSKLGLKHSAARLLPAGTVILSRTASVGFSGIMGRPMATTQDFVNWVPTGQIKSEYLLYVFRAMQPELKRLTMGSTHQTIYMPDVHSFMTPLPPLSVQREIVEHVQSQTRTLDQTDGKLRQQIDLLHEYRTALISAAVTGKIDVRRRSANAAVRRKQRPQFARALLAAEIVGRLHRHRRFGRVKLMKLLYLIEQEANATELGSTYYRKAAGPLDNRGLFTIEKILRQNGWYEVSQSESRRVEYQQLSNAGQHRRYLQSFWGDHEDHIFRILELLGNARTQQAEMVATLYAAWNDLLLEEHNPTDEDVISEILDRWHDDKRRIARARWKKALKWMRSNDLVPSGSGSRTVKM